ncbi:MAG TPA: response regulator [Candidatus Methylomirabilis sp.]|nr:response regulator [Candidatus Methylomirabilis sp.]
MGARILVADDSVTIQKVVELTFSKEDFVLDQARSGEEAIRKALEVRPDLVLVDMVMPDKNGYEVCAALRAEPTLRSVPIILLTGTFETFDKAKLLQAGANDFVAKPFESQVLISKVKQLLFARMVEKGASATFPGVARSGAPPAEAPLGGEPAPVATPPSGPPAEAEKPAPAAASLAGAADPDSGLSPPSEEISQDRLWQLLESTPPGAPEMLEPPREMSLDDLMGQEPALSPQSLLELTELDLEPAEQAAPVGEKVPPAQATAAEAAPLPERLILEDLLSTPQAPPPVSQFESRMEEAAPGEAVFDLTPDMGAPPLPLTEVGTGEPPALSMEDLLGSVAAGASGPDTAPAEIPELDLAPMSEGLTEEAVPSSELPGQSVLRDLDVSAEPFGVEIPPVETAEPGTPPEEDEWTYEAQARAALAFPEISPVVAAGEAPTATAFHEPIAAPPLGPDMDTEEATIPPPSEVTKADLASMRQEITERVARDLTRELSDKLVDRIEKIVWEVVPDLAEVLITKEIERIRAIAENQKPS